MSAGWRGLAGVPEARGRFRASLPVAIGLATELGCRKLNALAGNAASVETRETQLGVLVEGLDEAAEMASSAGISVMLEALNPVDFPGYLVLDSATALDVVARTGRSNVRYQLDVYHAVMGGEDPIAVSRAAAGRIGHVQFADHPGRHEPGTGTLDWPATSTRSTRRATTTGSDSSTSRRIMRPATSASLRQSAAGSPGRGDAPLPAGSVVPGDPCRRGIQGRRPFRVARPEDEGERTATRSFGEGVERLRPIGVGELGAVAPLELLPACRVVPEPLA